jgi:NADH:ubiquinone oxidoreductase subunit 6 (subunit J)
MLNVLIGAGCLGCAVMAIREKRLLVAALWLALTSALVAWMMFRLGALEVAAIELSVGAGLVTVLFVFAINIAGEETVLETPIVPRPLAWVIIALSGLLLAWMVIPALQAGRFLTALEGPLAGLAAFRNMVWEERNIDTILQVVIIFAGVMAVLGIMGGKSQEDKEG